MNLLMFFILALIIVAVEGNVLNNTNNDLVFRFANKNVSLDAILEVQNKTPGWSMADWLVMKGYNCKGMCNVRRQRSLVRQCYCDEMCMAVGDCCYDYVSRCRPKTREYWSAKQPSIYRCLGDVLLISKCPKNYNDQVTSKRCKSQTTLLERIPVFDNTTKETYQNIYCAKCHNATVTQVWKPQQLKCHVRNRTDTTNASNSNSSYEYYCRGLVRPTEELKRLSFRCISSQDPCLMCQRGDPFGFSRESEYWVHKICGLYKMPFIQTTTSWENPHCSLCDQEYANSCKKKLQNLNSPSAASLEVTVEYDDKTSPSELRKKVENHLVNAFSSKEDKYISQEFSIDLTSIFYSPPRPIERLSLLENKRRVYLAENTWKMPGNMAEPRINETTDLRLPLNCSQALLINASEVVFYPNRSIFLPFLGQMYPNGSYRERQSGVVICTPKNIKYGQPVGEAPSRITNLQILTYVGYALSFLAEIILLIVYSILDALRNRPGKVLMSLTACLVVYQILFLSVMLRLASEIKVMCVAIAVLLHYFLLVCFAWMSVMAFDIMKTFRMNTRSRSSGHFLFLKYCCYAFGLPMLIVLACFILDITDTVIFGYGAWGVCLWHGFTIQIIVTLHLPVGLLIVFDIVAISLTLRAIRDSEKASRMARISQKQAITTPLLCVKLMFAMGVPWVLGLLLVFVRSRPLEYVYVILNSLQGFFIGVLFLTSKRTINLIQKKVKSKSQAETGEVTSNAGQSTRV